MNPICELCLRENPNLTRCSQNEPCQFGCKPFEPCNHSVICQIATAHYNIQVKEAKKLAEKLVQEFYDLNKKAIEHNRKLGDTLGGLEGIPIHEDLEYQRKVYLSKVSPEIGLNHNFFNMAVVRIVLKR